MPTAPLRRTFGILFSLLLAGLVVGGTAGTAHAEDGYRYWNYFHLDDGAWAFSDKGIGQYTPQDGDVEGLRFGTSTASTGLEPRADLAAVTFDAICADPAPEGQKRVAFVIDYGTEADAGGAQTPDPTADCAVVDAKATSLQALESLVDVRAGDGLLCAIDGYPAKGCGDPVKNATVPGDEPTVAFALPSSADDTAAAADGDNSAASDNAEDDDNTTILVVIVAAAAVIGLGALALNRRRNAA
jgi:hypothetical protein